MSLEKNQYLKSYGIPALPWGFDNGTLSNTTNHTSILISLEHNANLKQVILDIETNISGIKQYQTCLLYTSRCV